MRRYPTNIEILEVTSYTAFNSTEPHLRPAQALTAVVRYDIRLSSQLADPRPSLPWCTRVNKVAILAALSAYLKTIEGEQRNFAPKPLPL